MIHFISRISLLRLVVLSAWFLLGCSSKENSETSAEIAIPKTDFFYLKASSNGKYVTLHPDGFYLLATADDTSRAEVFELIKIKESIFAFRSSWGKFVGADGDLSVPIAAKRDKADAWEHFEFIKLPSGKYNIRSFTGNYVCADITKANVLYADRKEAHGWEEFELIVK